MMEERATVVDFTKPYYTEGSTIASKAPDLKNQAKAVVSPFSFQVWVLLIVTLVIVGIATKYLHIAAVLSNNHNGMAEIQTMKKEFLFYHLFYTYSSLVLQDNKIRSNISSMRMILASWFLICIVFNALYSGNLCAVFAAPSYENSIDSLQDLLKALKDGHIYPICSKGTSIEYLFRKATTGIHQEIYKYFDPQKSFVNNQERYSKTAEGNAVVMTSMTSNIIKTNTYGPGRDKFYIGNENFYGQSYGIALPKGSPWANTFSKTLQFIVEAGLVELWITENIANQLMYIGVERDKGNVLSRRTNDPKPVSITQLQAAYFILVVGLILAFLSLIIEIIYNKYVHLQSHVKN